MLQTRALPAVRSQCNRSVDFGASQRTRGCRLPLLHAGVLSPRHFLLEDPEGVEVRFHQRLALPVRRRGKQTFSISSKQTHAFVNTLEYVQILWRCSSRTKARACLENYSPPLGTSRLPFKNHTPNRCIELSSRTSPNKAFTSSSGAKSFVQKPGIHTRGVHTQGLAGISG